MKYINNLKVSYSPFDQQSYLTQIPDLLIPSHCLNSSQCQQIISVN